MAANSSHASGFSYAQAAKGRSPATTSQPASSKVTSGSSTPAPVPFSELDAAANWADDVEATNAGDTTNLPHGAQRAPVEPQTLTSPVKPGMIAEKVSDISVLDPLQDTKIEQQASTTKEEPSASPESTADHIEDNTPLQSQDPAWIADRKERQHATQLNDQVSREEKKDKESLPHLPKKPVPLQDAPLPVVNPWLKRAEETKARTMQSAAVAARPNAEAVHGSTLVSQAKPKTKNLSSDSTKNSKHDVQEGGIVPNVKTDPPAMSTSDAAPLDSPAALKGAQQSTSQLAIKDEVSWPTPDSATDQDRKQNVDRGNGVEQTTDEATQNAKPKKKEWTSIVVTPNIIFETQNIRGREAPRSAERGSRGAGRGRGGVRGGTHAGDRVHRSHEDDLSSQKGTNIPQALESIPSGTKPQRTSSAGRTDERMRDSQAERKESTEDSHVIKQGTDGEAPPESIPKTRDARRVRSPRGADQPPSALTEDNTDSSFQRNGNKKSHENTDRAGARSSTSLPRREHRGFDNGRDSNTGNVSRGNKRGGRGRGGGREYANGHYTASAYSNGHTTDLAHAGSNSGVPPSPSIFQPGRTSHPFANSQQTRGGWPRGNARAPSLPMDNIYQRLGPFSTPQHLTPAHGFYPGNYDYQGYPMSAVSYQPMLDQQYLLNMVSTQLEYYFCTDNLLKDIHLRKHMDSQGFVFLDVIANFRRITQLTLDKDILRTCCINSDNIDIYVGEDNKERLRKRHGWEQFVLPMEQRTEPAQTEGPRHLQQPERPQLASWSATPFRSSSAARPPRADRRSYDAGAPAFNGFSMGYNGFTAEPDSHLDYVGPDGTRGRAFRSQGHEDGIAKTLPSDNTDSKDGDSDAFPDEQTSALTVVVKLNQQKPTPHPIASRTFSNGSIDPLSIVTETERAPKELSNGLRDDGPNEVNKHPSLSRGPSPSKDKLTENDISLFWMKDQSLPSEGLPADVTLEPYTALRLKALDQRSHAATGTCPYDLDVLYQFWCHFLIRNFNSRMYNEFKYFAHEDAKTRHNLVGLRGLVKFYTQSLLSQNQMRDRLLRDYVDLVNSEPAKLEGLAFKQLRSAWRNGALNLKNRKKLTEVLDSPLKQRLEA